MVFNGTATSAATDWFGKRDSIPILIGCRWKCPASRQIPQRDSPPIGPPGRSLENNKQARVKTVGMDAGKRALYSTLAFIPLLYQAPIPPKKRITTTLHRTSTHHFQLGRDRIANSSCQPNTSRCFVASVALAC